MEFKVAPKNESNDSNGSSSTTSAATSDDGYDLVDVRCEESEASTSLDVGVVKAL